MRVTDLSIESLLIPFKVSFAHSSAHRSTTEAVVVTVKTENGMSGKGEGCPRYYVTGETVASTIQFFEKHKPALIQLRSLGSLIEWSNRFSQEIKQNPAAFCAIELALLQALAQEKHQTIERLLSLPELSGTFRYSGILGTDDSSTFARLLNQYLQMGFTDFKVKLFGNAAIDHSNLRIIDATTQDQIIRIRFDANNLWQEATIACSYLANLGTQMFAVEEPLTARDFDGMRKLSQTLEVPVILDESFTRLDDFEQIYRDPERWIINVRVSKMGGLKRALAIAQQAEKIGVPIIIGAHVGETSILTRAALTVANVYKDNLVAQEGAFGTFLLEHDIVHPALMFTAGGTIKAEQV